MDDLPDVTLPDVPDVPPVDLPIEEHVLHTVSESEINPRPWWTEQLHNAGGGGLGPDLDAHSAPQGAEGYLPRQVLTEPDGPEMAKLPSLFYDPPQERSEERANLAAQEFHHEDAALLPQHEDLSTSSAEKPEWTSLAAPNTSEWPDFSDLVTPAESGHVTHPPQEASNGELAFPSLPDLDAHSQEAGHRLDSTFGPLELDAEAPEAAGEPGHVVQMASHLASIASNISKLVEQTQPRKASPDSPIRIPLRR